MSSIDALLLPVVSTAVMAFFLSIFFIWSGAALLHLPMTFRRSILVAAAAVLATWLIAFVFVFIPVNRIPLGLMAGLTASLFAIRGVFRARIKESLLLWVFYLAAEVCAIFLGTLVFE